MKYLGIDYGTKKIGLAVSDEGGYIAFPKHIILHSKTIVEDIQMIISDWGIKAIVIGKSIDMDGSDNRLQEAIQRFSDTLSEKTGLQVHFQDERMSSIAARSHLYGKGNIANQKWSGRDNQKKRDPVDAGAAAIILQRFLDRKRAK